jgi:hypothetical protein
MTEETKFLILGWGLIGVFLVYLLISKHPDPRRHTNEGERKTDPADDEPAYARILRALVERHQSANDESNRTSRTALFWTRLGAGLVAVYVVITFGIYWTGSDQEQRQLRAYVGLKRGEHIMGLVCPDCAAPNEANGSRTNAFKFLIKNFGVTPAFHLRVCQLIREVAPNGGIPIEDVLARFRECDSLNPVTRTNPTIWPSEERPYSLPLDLDAINAVHDVQLKKDGTGAMIAARIKYDDVFKGERNSYICYTYTIIDGAPAFQGCGNSTIWDDE